jgi:hypothetical protein
MSRRECSGFNAPRFSVEALKDVEGIPSAACRGSWSKRLRVDPSGFTPVVAMPGVSFQSRDDGVAQPDSITES